MAVEHTPTPWISREDGDANHWALLTADGKKWVISFLHNGEAMPEKQRANVALIIRAVNAHDQLIEALKLCRALSVSYPQRAQIDAALQAAGVEP
jgi:hypothetical protein